MTRVVLLGASPGPIGSTEPPVQAARLALTSLPGSPSVLSRLHGQLTSMDAEPLAITRPADAGDFRAYPGRVVESPDLAGDLRALAEAAEQATDNLFIIPACSVTQDELIYQLTKSKRGALALIAKEPREGENGEIPDENGAAVREEIPIDEAMPEIGAGVHEGLPVRLRAGRSRIVSAGSAYHAVTRPNAVALGPLHLHQRHAATLAEAARELADMAHLFGPEDDLVQLLVLGLVRRGVSVGLRGRRDLFFARVRTQEDADAAVVAMSGYDEDRARLNNAVKGADGFFTTYFVSTYSRFIARWAARRGLTPNQVTLISIALGVLAALAFATGTRAGWVTGGVLIYFAFVFDCVDGQLARYARKFGVLGAWLDATFDRAKEYVVFAGLAVGATVAGQGDVWTLALMALSLQSVRHLLDFSFGAANRRKPPAPLPTLDLAAVDDRPLREELTKRKTVKVSLARSLLRVWAQAGRFRAVHWARKMIVFPIGERFAVIAITAAVFEPRVTFLTLLIWGGVAAVYTLTGRLTRSLA